MIHGVGKNQVGGVDSRMEESVDPPPVSSVFVPHYSHVWTLFKDKENLMWMEVREHHIQAMTRYPNKSCKYPTLPLPPSLSLAFVKPAQTIETRTA